MQPIVSAKIVQLSIRQGLSPQSPLGIGYFGFLVARRGDIQKGYAYAKMGRKLLDKEGYKEVAGEVIAMVTQLMCFVEPIQCSKEFFHEGYDAALSAGDMHNALVCKLVYSIYTYWAGTKLPKVKEIFDVSREMMEKQ